MPPEKFLVVTDTPGIKQFVFGTDALAEVRGASALLDRLNRLQTEPALRDNLPAGATCEKVFANGGTGQFVVEAPNQAVVDNALKAVAQLYQNETGSEVHLLWGIVPYGLSYQAAVREAHLQMRLIRETASDQRTSSLMPLLHECSSTSHLPATVKRYRWGGESLLISKAAQQKREEARQAGVSGPWASWMRHLAQVPPWPDRELWRRLRVSEATRLEEVRRRQRPAARKGYVGLIYADGNAMGRLVQELDSPETCTAFSELVDGSIQAACHQALEQVCAAEIAEQRAEPTRERELPADILLLGGDDLVVLLTADVALPFALRVTEAFEEITRRGIAKLAPRIRSFFEKHVGPERGLTISCGVALAPAKYPFYLLENLAEDLLKSAKKGGSSDPVTEELRRQGKSWAPSYIDFHLVVGPAGTDLALVREEDYQVGVKGQRRRTLRPYRRDQLAQLRAAVGRLQTARLPRSKLQDLFDAALEPRQGRAEIRAQELFGRLRPLERQALWQALQDLGMKNDFPWCCHQEGLATALADLIEAHDLFPREETP